MYGDVVLGVQKREGEDHEPFETVIEAFKHERYSGDIEDSKLSADDQKDLVRRFKKLVKDRTGKDFPNSPWDQLRGAAGAVFSSWMNDRAIVYRRKYNIPAEWGTAVNVQARSSATPAPPPAPAWPSPATPPTARMSSTASSSSTPRARTSSPASAPPSPSSSSSRSCPSPTPSS
jgi:hypothetical protein